MLESLAISMRHTCSDEREVALYKLIGSLPRVRHLTLDLDVLERPRVPRVRILMDNDYLGNRHMAENLEALADHDLFCDTEY